MTAIRCAGLIGAGVLLWMFGLLALDVPADLPHWRIIAGAALLTCAVHLLQWAALTTTADNQEQPKGHEAKGRQFGQEVELP